MNPYHKEQADALTMVKRHLDTLPGFERQMLTASLADYLIFRRETDEFLIRHFSDICTQTCYQSRLSACCSREGIITYFADIVINLLVSDSLDFDKLLAVLSKSNHGFKCVYLTEKGCLWRLKPIVCQMYLCDRSKNQVFDKSSEIKNQWELLRCYCDRSWTGWLNCRLFIGDKRIQSSYYRQIYLSQRQALWRTSNV